MGESENSSDFSEPSDDDDDWGGKKKKKKKAAKNGKGNPATNGEKLPPPPKDHLERAMKMKQDLLRKIDGVGRRLPANTLDQLIDELGGPENVADMTVRKGRVVAGEDGTVSYESRAEADF